MFRQLWLILLFVCSVFTAVAQDSLYYDLTIRVTTARMKKIVPYCGVKLVDQNKQLIYEGCTDYLGELFLDSSIIRPNNKYTITISNELFHTDRNGITISTIDLSYSQNFVVDVCLSQGECWYFDCFIPNEEQKQYDSITKDIRLKKTYFDAIEGYEITRLGIWISFETKEEEVVLRAEAKKLLKRLKHSFPELEIEKKVHVDQLLDHRHPACMRVVRLG